MRKKDLVKAKIKCEKGFNLNQIEVALLKLDDVKEVKVRRNKVLITVTDKEKIDLNKLKEIITKTGCNCLKISNY